MIKLYSKINCGLGPGNLSFFLVGVFSAYVKAHVNRVSITTL